MARYILTMEAVRQEKNARRRRDHLHRYNFDMDIIIDSDFIKKYRLNKALFEEICQEVVPLLPARHNIVGISPVTKVLVALNFYARGSYQGSVAQNDDAPMSQQTVSKCIREVTNALNKPDIVAKYIKFPLNRQERTTVKSKFYNKYGIPGLLGCIDGTHIAIVRPNEHEERFFNRKSFHSLNVQMICDAECYILNVDAGYGGASHDSFIWNESEIKPHMESLTERGERVLLLGDSGYPLREYLITPFGDVPEDSPEGQFNIIQKKARATIERTFGILKGRFRCLLNARALHYHPETAGKITIACCILHNLCLHQNMEAIELSNTEREEETRRQPVTGTEQNQQSTQLALQRGHSMRASLVAQLAVRS